MASETARGALAARSVPAYLLRWRILRRRSFRRLMRFLCHLGRMPRGRLMVPMTGELARDKTDSNNKESVLSTTKWEESKWGTKDRDETSFEKIHVSR